MPRMSERPPPPIREPLGLVSFAAALAAGALLAARPPRGGRWAALLSSVALFAFASRRTATNTVRRAGARRRSAALRLSFVVHRPVERVFAFCSNFENFPLFVRSLRSVIDWGDGRSRWCASTPGGGSIEWDAVTTKFLTNRVIEWRSARDAPVRMHGLIRVAPENGHTRVQVTFDYAVFHSSLSTALAALVTRSTERELAEDIARVEAVIDRGAP